MKRVIFVLMLAAATLLSCKRGPATVAVEGVDISDRSLVMYTGEQQTLTATVRPQDATNKKLSWASSNETVATVQDGTVTAVAKGVATISATTEDGGFRDQILVTVVGAHVTGVSLSEKEITIIVNNKYSGLYATVTPEDAVNGKLIWTVSDEEMITLEENADGSVTLLGKYEGDGWVSVQTEEGGFSAICTVFVRDIHAESVSIEGGDFTLDTRATKQLKAVVLPEDAINTEVSWSTSDASVATVSETGLVTGVKAGTAQITVTTVDGGFTDTVTVTVKDVPVSSVSISQGDAASVVRDNTLQLTAVVGPENATNKAVTWSSSVPSVATVDQNGLVKALSRGVTTITVTTVDGSHTASITITVTVPITDIGGEGDFGESDYGEYN